MAVAGVVPTLFDYLVTGSSTAEPIGFLGQHKVNRSKGKGKEREIVSDVGMIDITRCNSFRYIVLNIVIQASRDQM